MLPRVLEPEVMDTWEDAVEYDSMDFTDVNTSFAERALELAPPSGTILDVGTGSGRIPILILQRRPDFEVIAIDLSENMLRIGQQNVRRAQMEDKIVLRLLDAKNLPFPDGSFDMVISNSLAHHLPDPLPFFEEIPRVLKADAGLLIRDLIRPETERDVEALVEKYADDCDKRQKKLYRDSLCASLTIEEVEQLVKQSDLRGASVSKSSDRHWSVERSYRRDARKNVKL